MFRSELSPRPRTGPGSLSSPRTLCDLSRLDFQSALVLLSLAFRESLQVYFVIRSASRGHFELLSRPPRQASLPVTASLHPPFPVENPIIVASFHVRKGVPAALFRNRSDQPRRSKYRLGSCRVGHCKAIETVAQGPRLLPIGKERESRTPMGDERRGESVRRARVRGPLHE